MEDLVFAVCLCSQWLDGTEINRSERIRAFQGLEEVKRRVWEQEKDYLRKRAKEKEDTQRKELGGEKEIKERKPGFDGRWYTDINNTMWVQVPQFYGI